MAIEIDSHTGRGTKTLWKTPTYMQALLYQQDEHISPSWRPCWGLFPQVLSCHITPHKTHQMTSNGGSTFSATQKSLGASLVHALLQTEVHTQIPVQASVLESLLKGDGEHGADEV